MARPTLLLFLMALLSSAVTYVQADEDWCGDNYAHVVATDGVFHVSFQNIDIPTTFWRITFSPEGKVLVPRHQLPSRKFDAFVDEGPRKWSCRFHRIDAASDTASPTTSNKQFRLRLGSTTGDFVELASVSFDPTVTEFADCWMNEDHAALLWETQKTKPDIVGNRQFMLQISWIPRNDPSKLSTVELGRIAEARMPQASPLVWTRGRLWVVWVCLKERQREMVLSNYDPVTNKIETKILDGTNDDCSHPSLAVSGDWLCAAWGGMPKGQFKTQIFTAFEKLPLKNGN